jgi:hypothetical protein
MSFRLNDDIVGRMLRDYSYKGSEHKEIFKKPKDVATHILFSCDFGYKGYAGDWCDGGVLH